MNTLPRAGFLSEAPGFRAATLGALGLLAVTTAGCDDLTLESRWRDREVLVDGRLTEWEGATRYLEEQRVSVGLLNDGSHLYLSLSTPDPALQRQVLAPGFTIRFSPEGSGGRSLGIRFPLGLMGSGGPPDRERTRERLGDGVRERDEAPDLETLVRRYQGTGVEMEILTKESTNSEEQVLRLGVEEASGIAVALGNMQGTLVYELQVPLTGGDNIPYAVGLDTETLDLKLETAVPNREEMGKRMGRGPPPDGGLGGGGGGPGGGLRGGGPPGGMPMGGPGSLNVRVKVRLARTGD